MTAKALLNQLKMLDENYGLDGVPIEIFHDGHRCVYTFSKLSIDLTDDRRVKELQINISKNGRYPKYSEL
jgi:hypothetical protein